MEPEEVKAEIYEAMSLINRAFQQITEALIKLKKRGVLSEDYVMDQQIINSESCARINCHVLATINQREEDDRSHYGKMRATLEKRIRGRQ
jgi:hypothetical protein